MKRQWILVGVVITLLTAGAVIGTHLAPDIFPVEVGARAPQFHAIDLNNHGDSTSLDRYKGQVVLLNIWATWCEPCRIELPSLERLQTAMGPQGLKIVSVSIDTGDSSVVRKFQRDYGLTFDILQDKSRAIERIYQTTGVPETFVIDRDGRILKKDAGARIWDSPDNQDLVRRLLARRG
ncbi:MAG TPA: TlpA disulfide reductase family protein [Gemmatimonadales bacterium]|jgi:peroxiredoxin